MAAPLTASVLVAGHDVRDPADHALALFEHPAAALDVAGLRVAPACRGGRGGPAGARGGDSGHDQNPLRIWETWRGVRPKQMRCTFPRQMEVPTSLIVWILAADWQCFVRRLPQLNAHRTWVWEG